MAQTVVQFTADLTAPDLNRLRTEYDLKLDRCVPDLGYIERVSPAIAQRLQSDLLVRACSPLDPQRKLSPSIADQQATPASPIEFSAALFDDADQPQVVALLLAAGAAEIQIASCVASSLAICDGAVAASSCSSISTASACSPASLTSRHLNRASLNIQSRSLGNSPCAARKAASCIIASNTSCALAASPSIRKQNR